MSMAIKLTRHQKDLDGGLLVSRLLPAVARQSVGRFVFFDHFGPATVQQIKPGATNLMTAGRGIVHTFASDTPVAPVGASEVRVLIGAAFGQISLS